MVRTPTALSDDAKVSVSLVSGEVSARTKVAESQMVEAEALVATQVATKTILFERHSKLLYKRRPINFPAASSGVLLHRDSYASRLDSVLRRTLTDTPNIVYAASGGESDPKRLKRPEMPLNRR